MPGAFVAANLPRVQAQYGRYGVERLLGEGAASKVYLASDPKLGRQVAVKVLAANAEPALRQRFVLEARAIAALKHPNIVALLDYSGEDDPALYLVLEYVPSRSLYAVTHEHGIMSEATALCVGHEIALALQHAHEAGVIHRDVKPENILLSQGRVVLTDFGGVKVVSPRKGVTVSRTDVLGTPGFMAPEQFAGRGIGPQTDVFSLGASLYNLTTGRIPYDGGSVNGTYHNLKSGHYVDPRTHRQILTPDFARLLSRCLAPRASDRFQSAGELRDAIGGLLAWHGVAEVRQELAAYERGPATYVVVQRERAVERLHSDLRDALREHDGERAHGIIERLRMLAPADPGLDDFVGVEALRRHTPRAAFRRGLAGGLALGLALGGGGAVVLRWWLGG